ncbi:MAG: hypothetical protein AUK30_02690 [Nitrospirae bacterium CG2_30_70_394]|nr:MAG: hypothetical protein AUK30_02690 [Nitrospirae bacterium CG2_30_70_394]
MAKRRATWKVDRSATPGGRRKQVDGLLAAAAAAHQAGDFAGAEAGYGNVLAVSAENAVALRLLGTLYAQTGRSALAIPLLERAGVANPRDDDAHNNLGLALEAAGRGVEAEGHLRAALRLAPENVERYANLGAFLGDGGRPAAAVAILEPAAARFPDHAAIHTNLGLAYAALHQDAAACAALCRAADLAPDVARVRRNLGLLLARLGRPERARPHLQAARALGADDGEVLLHLGACGYARGEVEEAEVLFRTVLAKEPDSPMAHVDLAAVLRDRGELAEAMAHLQRAVAVDPGCAEAYSNLATCHLARGEHAACLACDDRAVALRPGDLAMASRRLSRLVYMASLTPAQVAADHRAWGERLMGEVAPVARPAWDGAMDRPVRVGYVSADLRAHAVATFLEPILAAHDPAAVEVTCYSNVARPDAVTERLRGRVPRWRDITSLDDRQAAAAVVADGIDVLVDLGGHTARHRLTLFARRPAPVQVTYLGYATTTGLAAMDYRLTDGWLDPPGFESHYCERLVRLPSGWLCFQPPAEAGGVAGPPCLATGHTTFGSFNSLAKVGEKVVALWATLLNRVEGSRLLLKNSSLHDPETCGLLRDRFAAAGVDPQRLDLVGLTPSAAAHFALYDRVDIGLDPFPYAGGTTTCEALWKGVPVITLAGDRAATRFGVSTLASLGLEELIAADGDAYVALAAALAADRDRLAGLRASLRARMAAAPTLCRPIPFTRALEQAYRGMVAGVSS